MKKILFFLFFISNLILGREFISPKVSYDTISIKKTLDKSNKEVLIIYGLLSDKITVKEFYINNKFLLGERYRFNDNKELYKFYQRSVKFDKNLEVIEDREDIFYENGKLQQSMTLFPKGAPYGKKNDKFDEDLIFILTYWDREGKIEMNEAGKFPVVSNALFSSIFSNLASSKEVIDAMK